MQHTRPIPPAPRRGRRGQAMVEFALTATLLFLLVFGIIEVSRGILTINMLSNGAREAAHYAALHPELDAATLTANAHSRVVEASLGLADPAALQTQVDCPSCRGGASECLDPALLVPPAPGPVCDALAQRLTVTATVAYTFTTVAPIPGLTNGIPIVFSSTAQRER
jgi:Flp pilus assembly protein TadG